MTSIISGYDSGYGSIAGFRDYLDLTEISENDIEFLTMLPSPLTIANATTAQYDEGTELPDFTPKFENTIYGNISKHPQLQEYVKFIDKISSSELF